MTPALVAVALALLTAALLWEERSWQRTLRKRAAAAPRTLRCLCCEGAPLVEDIATHTRLAHMPRERAAEDFPEWSQQ